MGGKSSVVFGLYKTKAPLEVALECIRAEGIKEADISILMPDSKGIKDVLLSVHCDSPERVARVKDLLEKTGADSIDSTGEAAARKTKKILHRMEIYR